MDDAYLPSLFQADLRGSYPKPRSPIHSIHRYTYAGKHTDRYSLSINDEDDEGIGFWRDDLYICAWEAMCESWGIGEAEMRFLWLLLPNSSALGIVCTMLFKPQILIATDNHHDINWFHIGKCMGHSRRIFFWGAWMGEGHWGWVLDEPFLDDSFW